MLLSTRLKVGIMVALGVFGLTLAMAVAAVTSTGLIVRWWLRNAATQPTLTDTRVREISEPVADLPWIVRRPAGGDFNLQSVTFGQGQFVAVGTGGNVLSSPDGISWLRIAKLPIRELRQVIYADGRFVAVGSEGRIFTAQDPSAWTLHESGRDDWLRSVAYGSGRFVALGYNGGVISDDGVTWAPWSFGYFLHEVIWDGTRFLAVGPDHVIAESTDGRSFNALPVDRRLNRDRPQTGSEHYLTGITAGPERYVAVGGAQDDGTIFVSEDGVHWRRHLWLRDSLRRVCYLDGQFVTVGLRWVVTSPDGLTWTAYRIPGDTPAAPPNLSDVAWGNGVMVAVGWGGLILSRP